MNEKIGMYTEDEILEHLTEGEGRSFLGRSMYDAIFDKIHALKTENEQLQQENEQLKEVIEEVREYLTSYSSIHTIQFGTEEDSLNDIELNKMLDNKSITEMTYRYLKVHDKLLQILDKVKD